MLHHPAEEQGVEVALEQTVGEGEEGAGLGQDLQRVGDVVGCHADQRRAAHDVVVVLGQEPRAGGGGLAAGAEQAVAVDQPVARFCGGGHLGNHAAVDRGPCAVHRREVRVVDQVEPVAGGAVAREVERHVVGALDEGVGPSGRDLDSVDREARSLAVEPRERVVAHVEQGSGHALCGDDGELPCQHQLVARHARRLELAEQPLHGRSAALDLAYLGAEPVAVGPEHVGGFDRLTVAVDQVA